MSYIDSPEFIEKAQATQRLMAERAVRFNREVLAAEAEAGHESPVELSCTPDELSAALREK